MRHRSIALVIILSLVTLGIYGIYWLYQTRQELTRLGHSVPPFKLLLAPLLGLIIIGLLQFVVRFLLNATVSADGAGAEDLLPKIVNLVSAVVGVVAALSLVPISLYWLYRYCQAAEAVAPQTLSHGLTYGLWLALTILGLGWIWPGIMQGGFNKVADVPAATATHSKVSPRSRAR